MPRPGIDAAGLYAQANREVPMTRPDLPDLRTWFAVVRAYATCERKHARLLMRRHLERMDPDAIAARFTPRLEKPPACSRAAAAR